MTTRTVVLKDYNLYDVDRTNRNIQRSTNLPLPPPPSPPPIPRKEWQEQFFFLKWEFIQYYSPSFQERSSKHIPSVLPPPGCQSPGNNNLLSVTVIEFQFSGLLYKCCYSMHFCGVRREPTQSPSPAAAGCLKFHFWYLVPMPQGPVRT